MQNTPWIFWTTKLILVKNKSKEVRPSFKGESYISNYSKNIIKIFNFCKDKYANSRLAEAEYFLSLCFKCFVLVTAISK